MRLFKSFVIVFTLLAIVSVSSFPHRALAHQSPTAYSQTVSHAVLQEASIRAYYIYYHWNNDTPIEAVSIQDDGIGRACEGLHALWANYFDLDMFPPEWLFDGNIYWELVHYAPQWNADTGFYEGMVWGIRRADFRNACGSGPQPDDLREGPVNEQPGDQMAVYCDEMDTITVMGIDDDNQEFWLATVSAFETLLSGEEGLTIGTSRGNVSIWSDAEDNFGVVWITPQIVAWKDFHCEFQTTTVDVESLLEETDLSSSVDVSEQVYVVLRQLGINRVDASFNGLMASFPALVLARSAMSNLLQGGSDLPLCLISVSNCNEAVACREEWEVAYNQTRFETWEELEQWLELNDIIYEFIAEHYLNLGSLLVHGVIKFIEHLVELKLSLFVTIVLEAIFLGAEIEGGLDVIAAGVIEAVAEAGYQQAINEVNSQCRD